jgi:hypothetical protein
MFDEIAKTFFETEDEYERGLKLLREYGVAAKHSSNFTELEENFFLHVDDYDCQLLDSARGRASPAAPRSRATCVHARARWW